jgi:YggT family protein
MVPVLQSISIIVSALYIIYLMTVMVRFSIKSQKRALFNPIYNAFYGLNQKPIAVFEKVMPKSSIDWASLVYAYVVSLAVVAGLGLLFGALSPLVFAWAGILLLSSLKALIFFAVLIIVLASWIAPNNGNPALEMVATAVEPIMAIFRKVIPTIGGLDISPIALFIVLSVMDALILIPLKQAVSYPPYLMMMF